MTIRSKTDYLQYIETILPDNSSREISPADIRVAFRDLSDSVGVFLEETEIVASNFSTPDTRSTRAGELSLANVDLQGRISIDNTAYGYQTLSINYTGSRNTAIGSRTLACNSFGNDNVAVGYNSMGSNTAGSGNVAIGNYSLVKNPKGNHNIAIGHGAAFYVKDNSSQKLYVGIYPNASGDCETGVNASGTPPLLYGDLATKQLGIGTDIFVSGDVGLAVSGDILPASGQEFSIGHTDYRWNAYFNNVYIDGELDVPLAWNFDFSDQHGTKTTIQKEDEIFVSGVSGVETIFYPDLLVDRKLMQISAKPLSGVFRGEIDTLSADVIFVSGDVVDISGIIDNVSGWADQQIYNYAYISGYQVSGWADTTIKHYAEVSGYQVSGWVNNELHLISGFNGLLNDLSGVQNGLIHLASGWNKDYTKDYVDTKILNAGAFAHWEIEDQYGASGQIQHSDTVVVSGISGIETRMVIDEGAGGQTFYNLAISAAPVSGWASGVFTEISGVDGIIDTRVSASAHLISGFAYDIAVDKAADERAYTLLVSGWADQHTYNYANISGYQVSGWAASELLQISGWEEGRALYDVSGWALNAIADAVLTAGGYSYWTVKDEYNNLGDMHHSDVIFISGCSGIETRLQISEDHTTDTYRLDLSAAPLSGYMEHRFNQSSGIINSLSGIDGSISGAIYHVLRTSVGQIAGQKDSDLRTAIQRDDIQPLRDDVFDPVDGIAFVSGYKVSGWADANFHAISGTDGILNTLSGIDNGLIYLVSGWNEQYTQKQIANITFPDGQDQYVNWFAEANSGPLQAVGASRNVKFRGVNGLDSIISNDGSKTFVDISAQGLVDDLLEITGVNGIIDQKIDDAGGDGTLYIWSAGDDFGNTSPIGGSDVLKFIGEDGIVATVSTDDKVTISAGSLRTDIDNLRNKIDCIVDVNCGGGSAECCDNVSGWAFSNFTMLSGLDPTVYGDEGGLIWNVSGYLKDRIDAKLVSSNSYNHWKITDTSGPALEVENTDQITFEGLNGLTVSRDGSTIKIDGDPLSGVVTSDLLAISGVGGIIDTRIINIVSDPDIGTLALAKNYTNEQIAAVTGENRWVDQKLDSISGVNGTVTGVYDYAYSVSGHAQAISGWADFTFHQISGIDGQIPSLSGWTRTTTEKYAYESGVLVSGHAQAISGWADYSFHAISGIGGLLSQVTNNTYYGSSGIKLMHGDTFVTHGSGYFDKIITTRRDDASDPSGQIVADTGVTAGVPKYHDIVNASGYLVAPRYDKFTTLKTSLPASPANSGAIVFANGYPYQSQADMWSRPTVIEGFMRDHLLPPVAYSAPTSGRMYVRNDNFASDYEVYVTNRDFYLGISGEAMCIAMLINGEYRPVYGSPSGCES